MGVIDKWKKGKRPNSLTSKVGKMVERQLPASPTQQAPSLSVKSLRVEDRVEEGFFDDLAPDQGYVVNPEGIVDGDVLIAISDPDGVAPPTWTATAPPDLIITDGDPPASSPTPTVTGGPRWLAVNWDPVSNADRVTYEVHLSVTTGFTPNGSTLAGEIQGTLVFLRLEADGTPLEYDTPYFAKLIAKDDDGSAAAGAQGTDSLDPNLADDITAGAITAEKLEAILVLATKIATGVTDEDRVEIDLDGFRMYNAANDILVEFPTDGGDAIINAIIRAIGIKLFAGTSAGNDDSTIQWLETNLSGDLVSFLDAYHDGADKRSFLIGAGDPANAVAQLFLNTEDGGGAAENYFDILLDDGTSTAEIRVLDNEAQSDFLFSGTDIANGVYDSPLIRATRAQTPSIAGGLLDSVHAYTDFLEDPTLTQGAEGCRVAVSGTGAQITKAVGVAGHPGIWTMETGTTTSGLAAVRSGTTDFFLSEGPHRMSALIQTAVNLSSGTQRYFLGAGFAAGTVLSSTPQGCYFSYVDNAGSGTWQGIVKDGGGTVTDPLNDNGGAITLGSSTWYFLEVVYDGTDVKFYIDGILKGTVSTNIPTATGLNHFAGITKTVGTTSRPVNVDLLFVAAHTVSRAL